ncbi:MAG: hypothetical protein LQ344_002799 [Seirophora lacunosa]|nr:MAG: hypothetical protein LQ344_002799 [Seirophora lacunosa]
MSATRRTNGTPYKSSSRSSSAPSSKAQRTTRPASYLTEQKLLSPPELLLLLTYPSLLLLGSLFSLLDPSARNAPYSATSQSHPPEFAPNYFALKKNVFNRWFVKVGWFWFTVAWAVWVAVGVGMVQKNKNRSQQRVVEVTGDEEEEEEKEGLVLTPQRLRSVLRWAAVTTWWMLVTQWCFGPALIDRGFRLTGGACELMRDNNGDVRTETMSDVKEFLTAAACKVAGGEWKGGHDVSGHVFILVLGSAAVGMEVLGALIRSRGDEGDEATKGLGKWGWGVVIGVVGMSWWMLLMTAAYFHTWFEKSTGLLTASLAIAAVYILPRISPRARDIFGVPGQ